VLDKRSVNHAATITDINEAEAAYVIAGYQMREENVY
jgi:hypothetical protein